MDHRQSRKMGSFLGKVTKIAQKIDPPQNLQKVLILAFLNRSRRELGVQKIITKNFEKLRNIGKIGPFFA